MQDSAKKNPIEPRVAVVTGASAGIGKATAAKFLRAGWRVIGTGRDARRSAAAEAELRTIEAPGAMLDFLRGDFCEMSDVKRIADEIKQLTAKVDVLINNAGGVRDQRYVSSDGLEATMAANHFATFLLTRELMPALRAASLLGGNPARIIVVASSAHRTVQGMRWGDLNWAESYSATPIYCQAKLANMLFTLELARRAGPDGIVAQAMHPGVVASNFARHGDADMQNWMAGAEAHPPEHSAETLYWIASSPETGVDGGRYFYALAEEEPAPQARDSVAAARLWAETENILASLGY